MTEHTLRTEPVTAEPIAAVPRAAARVKREYGPDGFFRFHVGSRPRCK